MKRSDQRDVVASDQACSERDLPQMRQQQSGSFTINNLVLFSFRCKSKGGFLVNMLS